MNLQKELLRTITLSEVKNALSKHERLTDYINGSVFPNQVIAYTEEMNWSVNELIKHIEKINGLS